MKDIAKLLENNKAWARRVEIESPGFFSRLKKQQRPRYLWIGCSDSRVPANQITGLLPGDVFVHRHISNQVIDTDMNLMCVLQYARAFIPSHHWPGLMPPSACRRLWPRWLMKSSSRHLAASPFIIRWPIIGRASLR